MEPEASGSIGGEEVDRKRISEQDKGRVLVKKTLQTVLERCQRALELLGQADGVDVDVAHDVDAADSDGSSHGGASDLLRDQEADELCDLLKSRLECHDFLDKLESAQVSLPQNITEECGSWDMISDNDLWEDETNESDQEDYVLVGQEDIVEGITCFMAAYLLSLKQTKDLTPNQLQEVLNFLVALSKTFAEKKRKGKLRKAWDGSKVIYNVASWGATAIGIYQNPVILRAASTVFWTSCQQISKLL